MATPRAIGRQIVGTVIAVLSGWFAALLFIEVLTLVDLAGGTSGTARSTLWTTPVEFGIGMWVFILPVWLIVLIPLYLFVPLSSALWHWRVCTALGAVAGLVVMTAFFGFPHIAAGHDSWPFHAIAGIVGGVTCLVAALTKHRFKPAI
jgi:hypothetical protein